MGRIEALTRMRCHIFEYGDEVETVTSHLQWQVTGPQDCSRSFHRCDNEPAQALPVTTR